jgi:hypothetical protein
MLGRQNRTRILVRWLASAWLTATIVTLVPGPLPAQQLDADSIYQRFAPIDLTGTWVSIVTEDWHLRMITPPPGDFQNLPLTPVARDVATASALDQIEASGLACQAYAAPTIMREPGRVRILWEDSDTLRIDTDAGEQTRLFHFSGALAPGNPTWQGHSVAEWEYTGGFDPLRAGVPTPGPARSIIGTGVKPAGGKLVVETTNLRPGLLRKNGVPFSSNAELTEYYNLITEPDGTEWFIVTTILHDPENLLVDYITSSNFRRESNDASWNPTPCTLR